MKCSAKSNAFSAQIVGQLCCSAFDFAVSRGRSNIAAVRKMICFWEHYDEDAHAVISIIDK
eukprot:1858153-Rhodomonas_salina.1